MPLPLSFDGKYIANYNSITISNKLLLSPALRHEISVYYSYGMNAAGLMRLQRNGWKWRQTLVKSSIGFSGNSWSWIYCLLPSCQLVSNY